jgi:hypothetical protein
MIQGFIVLPIIAVHGNLSGNLSRARPTSIAVFIRTRHLKAYFGRRDLWLEEGQAHIALMLHYQRARGVVIKNSYFLLQYTVSSKPQNVYFIVLLYSFFFNASLCSEAHLESPRRCQTPTLAPNQA